MTQIWTVLPEDREGAARRMASTRIEQTEDARRLMRFRCEMAAYTVFHLTDGDRSFLVHHEIFPPKFCPLDL